ncbi:MAG: hypothetical protein ACYS1A_16485 [Planctomycetota bacterium]|jgi:hypothetical protein
MNNTDKKAEKYAKKSGAEFILAARKSDEQNSKLPEELKAINRLAAILGVWGKESWTGEANVFYEQYDSPCTNRTVICNSDIQKTCDKLSYAGKGDFAHEIKEHWQRVVDYANTADDNISVLRLQYQRGDIDKKVFAKKVELEANQPRNVAVNLRGRLELIARTYSGKPATEKSAETKAKKDTTGIGRIIDLVKRIADDLTKSDFLTPQEQQKLDQYKKYEDYSREIENTEKLRFMDKSGRAAKMAQLYRDKRNRLKVEYDKSESMALKSKLSKAKREHIKSEVPTLQKELDLLLSPRWGELLALSNYGYKFKTEIEYYFVKQPSVLVSDEILASQAKKVVRELERIKAKLEYAQTQTQETPPRDEKPVGEERKIESQEKDGQSKTDITDYKALNLANRTILFGTEIYNITSEKVWDFLKDLYSALRDDRLVPMLEGATNNKNSVDQLRKQISNVNLHKLIIFVNGGYKLNTEVKILGGGQIGIRKTHLSRKQK